ncbi:MAG: hypothetical protein MR022_03200 [Ruminococcus sp.]|nr:hypothetical protein [Ruminococcus sp.]
MKLKKIAASIAAGLLIMLPCADIGTSGSISASNIVSAYAVYENELDNYDDYDEYENDEYSGTESDSEVDSDSERNPLKSFIISLIIGIVIAAVSVGIMWSQMKTVRSQSGAANYEKKDTFKLCESTDTFLYKRLDKTPKPQNPPEKK